MGMHLRDHRVQARLTQKDAASLCGISRHTLARIENGDPAVSIGQVFKVAEVVKAPLLVPGKPVAATAEPAIRRRVRKPKAASPSYPQ